MTRLPAMLFALALLCHPAAAEWRIDGSAAIVSPSATNGTIELLAITCGQPFAMEVLARGGGVAPAGGSADPTYLMAPGRVEARVDGRSFPLMTEAAEGAVLLHTESAGRAGPIGADLVEAVRSGSMLTLAFDLVPDVPGADGSAHETFAEFPLQGSADALQAALAGCGQ